MVEKSKIYDRENKLQMGSASPKFNSHRPKHIKKSSCSAPYYELTTHCGQWDSKEQITRVTGSLSEPTYSSILRQSNQVQHTVQHAVCVSGEVLCDRD